jgi:hypothetical protein
LNYTNTVLRTHWDAEDAGASPADHRYHTLRRDAAFLGRNITTVNSIKYHQSMALLRDSFGARVLGIFMSLLGWNGLSTNANSGTSNADTSSKNAGEFDALRNIVETLTAEDFLALVDGIHEAAFTLRAWKGLDARGLEHDDVDHRTMCRMLQEIELLWTFQYAIRHADIGLIRHAVDPLIVHFIGAGQSKYSREMLYYRWLLGPACDPVLQRAVLVTGIVNWGRKPNGHKATDLMQEHLNLEVATSLKKFKNSSHDVDIVFDRMCLTNTWMKALRSQLEREFGQSRNPEHVTTTSARDMFLLGRQLMKLGLTGIRTGLSDTTKERMFDSKDIKMLGMRNLAAQTQKFNAYISTGRKRTIAIDGLDEHAEDDTSAVERNVGLNSTDGNSFMSLDSDFALSDIDV